MTAINHGCWVTGTDRICEHGTKGCGHVHGQPAYHLGGEEAGVEAREENDRRASMTREEFWRRQAVVDEVVRREVCGDVEALKAVVVCECGRIRQHDRPHGFSAPESKSNGADE